MISMIEDILEDKAVVCCYSEDEFQTVFNILATFPNVNSDVKLFFSGSCRCLRIDKNDHSIHHGSKSTYVDQKSTFSRIIYEAVDFLLIYNAKKMLEEECLKK